MNVVELLLDHGVDPNQRCRSLQRYVLLGHTSAPVFRADPYTGCSSPLQLVFASRQVSISTILPKCERPNDLQRNKKDGSARSARRMGSPTESTMRGISFRDYRLGV
jgi:hypothetical protein